MYVIRHPQKRKYITYRNAAKGEPNQDRKQQAQNLVKVGHVVFELCEPTDRQTDRTTDKQNYYNSHPSWG